MDASGCEANHWRMHEWVNSLSSVAAEYLRNRVGSPVDEHLIRHASREALINNVKLNGIPPWLMEEIERHTKDEMEKTQ